MRRIAAMLLLLAAPAFAEEQAPSPFQMDEVPVAKLTDSLAAYKEAGLEVVSIFPAQTVSRQECIPPPIECFEAAPGQRVCVDPAEPTCATVTETVTVKVVSRSPAQ